MKMVNAMYCLLQSSSVILGIAIMIRLKDWKRGQIRLFGFLKDYQCKVKGKARHQVIKNFQNEY